MIIEYGIDNYKYITDNTETISSNSLFLLTEQNKKYYNNQKYITVPELYKKWDLESLRVVGITGTNGKTTTTAIIYSILLDLGNKVAMQGTRGIFILENRVKEKTMTTPSILETLQNMKLAKENLCDYFIMEVSSHSIKQNRIEGIKFSLKVITNISSDHLDYHKTIEEYRKVKSSFFSDDTPKLLNKDDIKNIEYNAISAKSYGIDEPSTFSVKAFSINNGIEALITNLSEKATLISPMLGGLFNLYNLLAGVASVSILTGEKLENICKEVKNFAGVSGRMQIIKKKPLIIVDFAHTEDGMRNVFESLKNKDIVVLFGAGGDRDKIKRPKMGAIAEKYAKKIYITTDNPRYEKPEDIIQDILKGIKNKKKIRAIMDRTFAINEALKELEKNEVLLILGKGDEEYQEVNGKKIPYNDLYIVKTLLNAL